MTAIDRHFAGSTGYLPGLSPAALVWRRFRGRRVNLMALGLLCVFVLLALFGEAVAPYGPAARQDGRGAVPPQTVHLFHDSGFVGPFVYRQGSGATGISGQVDRIRFFCAGEPYRLAGLVEGNVRLMCPAEGGTLFLLGTDRVGRDIFSSTVHATRHALGIVAVGLVVALALGALVGIVAGLAGGRVDAGLSRTVDAVRSFPELPLWLVLAAALPDRLGPSATFWAIGAIAGLFSATGIARTARAATATLVAGGPARAARRMGGGPLHVFRRHVLPGLAGPMIYAAARIAPTVLLGETAISLLGFGLVEPYATWGVLLAEAGGPEAIAAQPWLVAPLVPVALFLAAATLLADGLRLAADPADAASLRAQEPLETGR